MIIKEMISCVDFNGIISSIY